MTVIQEMEGSITAAGLASKNELGNQWSGKRCSTDDITNHTYT